MVPAPQTQMEVMKSLKFKSLRFKVAGAALIQVHERKNDKNAMQLAKPVKAVFHN